jgi:hypothetical protein
MHWPFLAVWIFKFSLNTWDGWKWRLTFLDLTVSIETWIKGKLNVEFMIDSLKQCSLWKREIFTVKKGKFWQFGKENFDSLEKENFDGLERKILTVWNGKFWQFGKEIFVSLKRKILTVWEGKFWQFWKRKFNRQIQNFQKRSRSKCILIKIHSKFRSRSQEALWISIIPKPNKISSHHPKKATDIKKSRSRNVIRFLPVYLPTHLQRIFNINQRV